MISQLGTFSEEAFLNWRAVRRNEITLHENTWAAVVLASRMDLAFGSPDDWDPVPRQIAIAGHNDEVFGERLSHQNPVEGIFVDVGKTS